MPGSAEPKTFILCQDTIARLESDLALADGAIIPAGSRVLLLPQTIAACVLMPDGESLASAWGKISMEGHSHKEIADYSEQLIRFATRLAPLEARLSEFQE